MTLSPWFLLVPAIGLLLAVFRLVTAVQAPNRAFTEEVNGRMPPAGEASQEPPQVLTTFSGPEPAPDMPGFQKLEIIDTELLARRLAQLLKTSER